MHDHEKCDRRGGFNGDRFCNGCGAHAVHWYRRKTRAWFTRCWHAFGDVCERCGLGLAAPPKEKKGRRS